MRTDRDVKLWTRPPAARSRRPTTVLQWLDLSRATDILRELGAGVRPVSHATLDELPEGNPLEHLRSMQEVSTDPLIPLITTVPTMADPELALEFIDRQQRSLGQRGGVFFRRR